MILKKKAHHNVVMLRARDTWTVGTEWTAEEHTSAYTVSIGRCWRWLCRSVRKGLSKLIWT